MNEVVESIQRFIQKKTGRFSNIDQIEIYNEIINYLDDQVRMSMMQGTPAATTNNQHPNKQT